MWLLLLIVLILIPLLYMLYMRSEAARYYVRMTFYMISIVIASFLAIPVCIPGYFLNKGGLWAFNVFIWTASWIDINVEVRGKEILNQIKGPAVIVANHQSSLDLIPMGLCWPDRCTVMMKSSLKWVPGLNICAVLCDTIFVTRSKKEAHAAIVQASKTIHDKGLKIWVFPEGTRHRTQGFEEFKKGAFNIAVEAQIPIVPVVISSYSPFYLKAKKFFRWPGYVIAQVLQPIETKGLVYEDAPKLLEKVKNQMLDKYEEISVEAARRHNKL